MLALAMASAVASAVTNATALEGCILKSAFERGALGEAVGQRMKRGILPWCTALLLLRKSGMGMHDLSCFSA
jgi:hypothetical protein